MLAAGTAAVRANTDAEVKYVINLGGTIIANATFAFAEDGAAYTLKLNANVTGLAQLVASGTVKANSAGSVTGSGLLAQDFDIVTRASGDTQSVKVQYAGGNVSAFIVDPPIVNNIDRVPVERKQLIGVTDMFSAFMLKADGLSPALCSGKAQIFTGVERFDLKFSYVKDDVATSQRTGYQGPVVLCKIQYKPISGHYTTSEFTNSLAQGDRILVWFAPLNETGWYVPYRVLLTTSQGDLSLVLTEMSE